MPPSLLFIEAGLFGLVLGSFLNVCIYRLPLQLSLGGRSFCPSCKTQLRFYENIPLISFILQKGRCLHCHRSVSLQYPLVELLTVGLSLLTLWQSAFDLSLYFIWFLFFVSPLVVVTFIDIRWRIIPDLVTLPGIPVGFLATLFLWWPHWTQAILFSLGGALCGGGALLLLGQLYLLIRKREGMGGGDIKLATMLGGFLGWKGIVFVFLISSLLAIIYALIAMIFKSKTDEGPQIIPYGPFLSLAALIFHFYGMEVLQFYFNLL